MKNMLTINNPEFYANLFISRMPKKAKRIFMYGINHKRSIEMIMDAFPDTTFVVADRECNFKLLRHFYTGKRFTFINTTDDKNDIKIILEIMKMPKFDVAIMNPPYGGVCKEIYTYLFNNKICDTLISINPAQYWEFIPYLCDENHKEIFFSYLKKIDIINHNEFCGYFNIGNGVTGNGAIVEFNYKEKNNKKEIEKLYNKIVPNSLLKIVQKMLTKTQKTLVSVKGVEKNKTQKVWVSNYKKYKEYGNFVKIYTWHSANNPKDMIICPEDGNGKSIIGTKTKKELNNFVNSLNGWPYYIAYHITNTDNAKMLSYCPWMIDYTKPWTNQRFCEYFGITGYISDTEAEKGSEWENILKTMAEYK